MALSNKAKSYIQKHYKKKSAKEIADILKLEIADVQAYITEIDQPLPLKKKITFYSITFSIPVLFFVILEIILRSTNYLGNTDLFIDPKIPTDEYLIPNPNFAARYFFYTNVIPNPSIDVFLADKPENGYRVFAMGGSSAAGYPYGFNGTYSRVVNDVLQDAMPDKTVEVINVGISAVNSYTLYDQVDEIIEHKPDAIMVYAGHNEFYGALGVGSNENLGGFPGFVRFYLKLQRFKTFLFLRTIIVGSGKWFATTFGGEVPDENATLMERIINSRSIELDSPKHQLAMVQFESNLSAIVQEFQSKNIPVFIGSVASNLKDHSPFVDITDGEQPSALKTFYEAQAAYDAGNYLEARNSFRLAKDLDGLKFRAPTEINKIIKSVSDHFSNAYYVPVEENMEDISPNSIIGFNVMLEHLHPNQKGYFSVGKSFSEQLLKSLQSEVKADFSAVDWSLYLEKMLLTDFDHRIAWHRVATLKQGFPFVQEGKPTPYQLTYQPTDPVDSLAFDVVHRGIDWDKGKVAAAQYYQSIGKTDQAINEYLGLVRNQPWNDSPYVFAARLYLDRNQFADAEPLLRKAFEINPNEAFIAKMLGAIELNQGNTKEAIRLLEKSRSINPRDAQMLYNLSGAYGTNQEFEKALKIAQEAQRLRPNFPGLREWIAQLNQIIQSRQN